MSLDINEEIDIEVIEEIEIKNELQELECDVCGTIFNTRRTFENHKKIHQNPKIQCELCQVIFLTESDLNVHKESKNCSKKRKISPPICQKCKKKFETRSTAFYFHVKNCQKFVCLLYCGAKFDSIRQLKNHEKTHKEETRFCCEVCNKSFATDFKRINHEKNVHGKGDKFACQLCNSIFQSESLLIRHLRKTHETDGFRCKVCDEKFSTKERRDAHEVFHKVYKTSLKSGSKSITTPSGYSANFKCDICGAKFFMRDNLEYHRQSCEVANFLPKFPTKERVVIQPYSCQNCQKSFLSEQGLESHILNQECVAQSTCEIVKETFRCFQCGQYLDSKEDLKDHEKEHLPESFDLGQILVQQKRFPCDRCNDNFESQESLDLHKTSHSENAREDSILGI